MLNGFSLKDPALRTFNERHDEQQLWMTSNSDDGIMGAITEFGWHILITKLRTSNMIVRASGVSKTESLYKYISAIEGFGRMTKKDDKIEELIEKSLFSSLVGV